VTKSYDLATKFFRYSPAGSQTKKLISSPAVGKGWLSQYLSQVAHQAGTYLLFQ